MHMRKKRIKSGDASVSERYIIARSVKSVIRDNTRVCKLIKYLDGLEYDELVAELENVSNVLRAADDGLPSGVEINGKTYILQRPVMLLIDGLMERIEQLESEVRCGN